MDAAVLVQAARQLPVLLVRRHEGAERDAARVGKQLADLGHPPDVLLAVLGTKAEVFIQSCNKNQGYIS